jgi:hypothetical protein
MDSLKVFSVSIMKTEKRCYMRDPDGYLIEVVQTMITATPLELYR